MIYINFSRSGPGSGKTDPENPEDYKRLFVICSKSMESGELRDEFSSFGDVVNAHVIKHKDTGNSKGCAYVSFKK